MQPKHFRISMHLNILQKAFGTLLFVSIVPLLLVGVSSYQVSRDVLRDQATAATAALVSDQKQYLDLQLQQINSLIANISGVEEIIDGLDQPVATADTYTSLATQARIGYILNGYTNLKGLVSIDIFTMRNIHYHVGDTLNVSNIRTDLKNQIFAQALGSDERIIWTGIEDNVNANSSYKKVITAAKILTTTDLKTWRSRPVALLLVNYSVDTIYDHFSRLDLGSGAYLMLVDAQNRIIYHPDTSVLGDHVSATFMHKLNGTTGTFTDAIEGQSMIVTFHRSDLSDWVVVSFIPVATLMAPTATIGVTMLLVLLAVSALVAIAAWFVSRNMAIPIRNITNGFKRIQAGELAGQVPLVVRGQDEIGKLTIWFNTFVESLQAKQRAEAALRESEERYSLALRGANDGIWDWDLRNDTVHFSSRWKSMLGYSDDEIGASLDEWLSRVHADDLQQVKAALDAHLDGSVPHFESEHRLMHRDATTYSWVLARGLAVRDTGENAYRMAGSLTDITLRKAIEARLWHDSMHDQLTNLPNRGYFMEQLHRAFGHAKRRGDYLAAVLFLDLDRFKIVNDSLGHVCGDQLLITTARRLKTCVRMSDTIARFGGDEFAILLDGILTLADATEVADRIQHHLGAPLLLQEHTVSVSASIGIALLTAAYNRSEDLLRDADTALYQAKARGRAQFAIFDTEMHANTLALLKLEADLKHAIEHLEFRLYYQPIVSLEHGTTIAVEALLRWEHPERGLILPGEFIALAEETGLIEPIGEWVLRTACAQAKCWHDSGYSDLVVAVNISSRQLRTQHLADLVGAALAESGLPGWALQLEIAESTAMTALDLSIQNMRAVRALGVNISMDDFGTSYSSLGHLKRFPINRLKIAQSFIRGVAENPDDAAIGSAIIAMAHILGLRVVAVGVETTEQLSFLIAHGCDEIQGFLLTRARSPAELMTLLQAGPNLALSGNSVIPL